MAARRGERVEQLGFFDPPTSEDPPAPKAAKPASKAAKYSDYQTVGGKCVDCAQLVYEERRDAGSSTRVIRQARVKRVVGTTTEYLCHAHAQARKLADEGLA